MHRFLAFVCAALLSASSALAQNAIASYPNRPIRIIVCMSAGGGVDTVTRIVANRQVTNRLRPLTRIKRT
jgi:tripartite-type tricarboxylate transporter receptor subunit TctC